MAKTTTKKASKSSEKDLLKAGFYKGYDIRWLRDIPEHPEFHLVAEYENLELKK